MISTYNIYSSKILYTAISTLKIQKRQQKQVCVKSCSVSSQQLLLSAGACSLVPAAIDRNLLQPPALSSNPTAATD